VNEVDYLFGPNIMGMDDACVPAPLLWPLGDGDATSLIRNYEWSRTALGSSASWPQSLRSSVDLALACNFPMIVLWGKDLYQIYNDAYRELMGNKHPAGLGQATRECWPEVWQFNEPVYARVLAGEAVTFEDQLYPITRHGYLEDAYFTLCYSPLRHESGSISDVLVTVFEKTEQMRAKAALEASEARLSELFDQAPAFFAVLRGPEHIFELTNPLYQELVDFRDVLGKPIATALPEAAEQGFTALLDQVYRTGVPFHARGSSIRIDRRAEGGKKELFMDFVYQPLREADKSISGVIVLGVDVTDAKLKADALAAIEADLHWTIELSPHNPWTADPQGQIVHFNTLRLGLTNLTDEVTVGADRMQIPDPEDRPLIQQAWSDSLKSGKLFDVEHRARLATGDVRWMRSRALPRYGDDGQIVRWYGSTEDIHDRRMGELALIQSEKLAAVGRLASSIAHEINNPLEAVMNLLYLARTTLNDPTQVTTYVAVAESELQRVSQITKQTLRFHKQSTSRQTVSCMELVKETLSLYEGRLANSNIRVETRKRASKPIKCFDGEIRQVLNNLVANAFDARSAEDSRMLVRSREGLDWTTGRRGLIITIADNGIGMSAETQKKIFEPFFTTKGIGGVGLGLWVSCEIVERHKGKLSMRSTQRPGRAGTTFALFLPYD
jgi:PAS domain S-box-containing protein